MDADFRAQLKRTKHARKPVRAEVERLWDKVKGRGKVSDEYKKWEFLAAQLQVHEDLMKALVAYDGAMLTSESESPEKEELDHQMYQLMTVILADTEEAFQKVLSLPMAAFTSAWQQLKRKTRENPLMVLGGAAVAGASVSAAALPPSTFGPIGVWIHNHALFHVGIGKALASKLGCSLMAAGGAAGGLAVLGALLVGGISYALYRYFQKDTGCLQYSQEQAALRVQMEELTGQLTASPDSVEALKQVQEMYQEYFMNPLVVTEGTECLICLEKIAVNAVEGDAAVRTPACKGTHFMHRHCWDRWCETNSNQTCPECRC